MPELGELVQDARKNSGMSVQEVADRAGISVGTMRAIEQGRRAPSVVSLKPVLEILELQGQWVNETTWMHVSGSAFELKRFAGDNRGPRGRPHIEGRGVVVTEDTDRLAVIRQILDADPETIKVVKMLLDRLS